MCMVMFEEFETAMTTCNQLGCELIAKTPRGYELFKTSTNIDRNCIVRTENMFAAWKIRPDVALPYVIVS